ncbi:IclR family transcriptional regulator [Salibacterium salarium]|uniref:IclR family transcriptional regulator n=1 Tax=Salibacterium salarium TaxID=284579 RepID=A0A3R9QUA4_9BACI|nr:IclR family transcriptional regulator [Salibacterium salarium]RSL33611.1 IclR family transcriptional regulator [Salibacterium salarium]
MNQMDDSLKPLKILEALSNNGEQGMSITNIASETNLSKSTIHRLVKALLEAGYIIRHDSSKTYKLGYRILHITSGLIDNLEIKEVARPYLQQLNEESNETIHLVQLEDLYGVYIDKIDTPETIGLLSRMGKRIMLHSTAAGKVLLAHMSQEAREKVYEEVGLPQRTKSTFSSKMDLEEELTYIKNNGYALDRMENKDGIYCIAGPIFNQDGSVLNSFSISGPSFRFTKEDAENLSLKVIETSKLLSKDLVSF